MLSTQVWLVLPDSITQIPQGEEDEILEESVLENPLLIVSSHQLEYTSVTVFLPHLLPPHVEKSKK